MKRISLIAVIVLFASTAGLAQGSVSVSTKKPDGVIFFDQGKDASSSQYVPSSSLINSLIGELSEQEDVTSITVTKSLLDMIPEIHSYTEVNGLSIKKIIGKLEHIDILISKNHAATEKMKTVNKRILSQPHPFQSEILMKIKNEQENIIFYGEKSPRGDLLSFIMFADGKEQSVLIRLTGTFSKSEIEDIIKLRNENRKNSKNSGK
ncbi:MAG: DUF4252 domain-containing protein [Prevotellaceae bacterium]|jgi:hypothetical protein|nr:DUF4252 domain-containing protein [Prevotellaceae bacterium]